MNRSRTAIVTEHLGAWGLTGRTAAWLITAPLALMLGAIVAALSVPEQYIGLTNEDGVVEWLQVVALVVAGLGFLAAARFGWRNSDRLIPLVHALVGVAALIVAAEEISWGQRIIGWPTPELFDDLNYQDETNFHNIIALESVMKVVEIGAGAFGTFVPLAASVGWGPSWIRTHLLVPPVALVSFFVIPFLHWSSRILIDPARPIGRLSEAAELALFTGGAIFAWLTLRRLRGWVVGRSAASMRRRPETVRG